MHAGFQAMVPVVMASPNRGHKCDGATVQVQPSSLSCEAIQKNLTQTRDVVEAIE
jgi:hypothetical protein